MDAYFKYNQMKKEPFDASKSTFMSNHDNYYYNVILFRLMNTCTTYQRLMDTVFSNEVRSNVKVYIDDMIEKTPKEKLEFNGDDEE